MVWGPTLPVVAPRGSDSSDRKEEGGGIEAEQGASDAVVDGANSGEGEERAVEGHGSGPPRDDVPGQGGEAPDSWPDGERAGALDDHERDGGGGKQAEDGRRLPTGSMGSHRDVPSA